MYSNILQKIDNSDQLKKVFLKKRDKKCKHFINKIISLVIMVLLVFLNLMIFFTIIIMG